MKTKTQIVFIAVSVVLTSIVTSIVTAQIKDASNASFHKILRQAELVRAFDRAEDAYFKQPPQIARWEAENLITILAQEPASLLAEPRLNDYQLFVCAARLARLSEKANDNESYQDALRVAIEYGSRWDPSLIDATKVMKRLDYIDEERSKVQ